VGHKTSLPWFETSQHTFLSSRAVESAESPLVQRFWEDILDGHIDNAPGIVVPDMIPDVSDSDSDAECTIPDDDNQELLEDLDDVRLDDPLDERVIAAMSG
jgi:hypothetical protein